MWMDSSALLKTNPKLFVELLIMRYIITNVSFHRPFFCAVVLNTHTHTDPRQPEGSHDLVPYKPLTVAPTIMFTHLSQEKKRHASQRRLVKAGNAGEKMYMSWTCTLFLQENKPANSGRPPGGARCSRTLPIGPDLKRCCALLSDGGSRSKLSQQLKRFWNFIRLFLQHVFFRAHVKIQSLHISSTWLQFPAAGVMVHSVLKKCCLFKSSPRFFLCVCVCFCKKS